MRRRRVFRRMQNIAPGLQGLHFIIEMPDFNIETINLLLLGEQLFIQRGQFLLQMGDEFFQFFQLIRHGFVVPLQA